MQQCSGERVVAISDYRGIPGVKIIVGGETLIGLLDTGAGPTVVSPKLYERHGKVPSTPGFAAGTLGEDVELKRGKLGRVSFVGCSFEDIDVAIASAPAEQGALQIVFEPGVILLGREFMDAFDWTIDFSGKTARVAPASQARNRLEEPFGIEVDLQGDRLVCLLDTGFAFRGQVFLFAGNQTGNRLRESAGAQLDAQHEASESGLVSQIMVAPARVGGLKGDRVLVDIEKPSAANPRNRAQCTVGVSVLAEAQLKFGPAEPIATATGSLPPPMYNRAGIRGMHSDESDGVSGLVLDGVLPGSSFDKAGLKPGDKMVSFNGRPALPISFAEVMTELYALPAGAIVVVSAWRDKTLRTFVVEYEDPLADDELQGRK